ncbi:hypothetical protein OWM54_19970 [Myxococcus sp. MISCRS1]|jgi:hypothetical protein|uniref:hypothetical protein n=1 Tax=Myxococcus TaxID=32 RepID=UPI001CC17E11|nr:MULTISPECIES: hypothetical protein [unclassified Myxococcus]MBZ4414506.1 hypothetical protein [Myxococcus sp. XM-1-1-1]MCY0999417.1 hypothetical protein [Myxococcus sp. MISCRS1]BDT30579.1 hypothetical protein MFMH1_02480 [Myxococcus sp. MH1]
MTKYTAKLVGIGITALIGTAAWAGAKSTNTVLVNLSAMNASGSMGDARNSADTRQFIGCSITTYVGSAPTLGCFAMDSAGNYGGCSSTNADLVATARSITTDSYLVFNWDAWTSCTSLHVTNASHGAPKQP